MNLTELDSSALIISAIIHDFKHPGVTNSYLINSKHNLALTYNGRVFIKFLILIKFF